MHIAISVCIPVYNCAEFLEQSLDSVMCQSGDQVDVIVFDGGSTDGTEVLMLKYIETWPNLHYYRSDHRGGIDADLSRCVEMAQGEFCWLFSGDDVMRPGAIARALEQILSGGDVYICAHTLCDKNMSFIREYPPLLPNRYLISDFSEKLSRQQWFERAMTTEAFFSFMSGLIVRRDKWMSGELPDDFNGSCWGHVARLFGLMSHGLRVCYVAEVWLDKRGDNDSFADNGIVNRFRIAIEGYHKIANVFFGKESIEAFHIRRVVRNEFGLGMFLSVKLLCQKAPRTEDRKQLDGLVRKTYSGDFSLRNNLCYLLYCAIPARLYGFARLIYRRMFMISM